MLSQNRLPPSIAGLWTTADLAPRRERQAIRFTENGHEIEPSESQLWRVSAGPRPLILTDSSGGNAALVGFGIDEHGRHTAFYTRVGLGSTVEIETLIIREGEAFVFGAANPQRESENFTKVIAREHRSPRQTLIAIANAYFDGIERADGSQVPACGDCHRSENGARTTAIAGLNGCTGAMKFITTISSVRDRRFPVVDESRGLVHALTVFDIPTGVSHLPENGVLVERRRPPRSVLFGHIFKISGQKICEIAALLRNAPLGASAGWPVQRDNERGQIAARNLER